MPSCVVSGSMRRHLAEMQAAAAALSARGVRVLSPRSFDYVSERDGFVFVDGDSGDEGETERHHVEAIEQADFLYLVCPAGYVGRSAAREVGHANGARVPVYASEEPEDQGLKRWVEVRAVAELEL